VYLAYCGAFSRITLAILGLNSAKSLTSSTRFPLFFESGFSS
jgi:hypothetical protein